MWWKGNSSHILPRSAASIFTFTLTGSMFYNRKNNLFWKSKSLSVFSFDYIYYACWNASEGFTQFLFSLSRSMHTKHLDLKKSLVMLFAGGGAFIPKNFDNAFLFMELISMLNILWFGPHLRSRTIIFHLTRSIAMHWINERFFLLNCNLFDKFCVHVSNVYIHDMADFGTRKMFGVVISIWCVCIWSTNIDLTMTTIIWWITWMNAFQSGYETYRRTGTRAPIQTLLKFNLDQIANW